MKCAKTNQWIKTPWLLGGLLACCLWGSALANTAVEVGGAKFQDITEVHGMPLVLNGAGVRYKAIFKVYAAGLYLEKRASTPEQVLATPGAKRMQLVLLRDVDAGEMGNLFVRGVNENTPKSDLVKLIPGLVSMGKIFADQKKITSGDVLTLDWIPGIGTVVSAKGVQQGEPIKEPEFFGALLRIWLGTNPPDWKLKSALLGLAS